MSNQLDVGSIVDGLMNIEKQPITNLQTEVQSLQGQVSAYQSLNTNLSSLSDKVNTLLYGNTDAPSAEPYSFADRLSTSAFAKCTVTSSDEDTVTATAANVNVGGSYSLTVGNLAQAQATNSTGLADKDKTSIGTGSITIKTGQKDPTIINITDSNNTLAGLQTAINDAGLGITATIVNDGSATPYKLMLSSKETGTANAFTISTNLSGGSAISFSNSQTAQDAEFVINGASVKRSSNTINDIINGVTFTLKNTTTSPVTLSLANDQDSIVSAIKDFVTAYNAVNTFINSQFAYNSSTQSAGVLAGDPTLRNVQSELQTPLAQGTSNRYTSLSVTGQAGLNFNSDGSLTLNESDFRTALSNNFTSVAALFLGDGTDKGTATSSDSRVTYNTKTSATQAGSYDVSVTSLAKQASATGSQPVTSLTDNETLSITCGTATAAVNLLQNDSLDMVLQRINSALTAQGIAATATDDGSGKVKIATSGYGSSQALTIVSNQGSVAGTTGFGISPITVNGTDIAGTIGGDIAVGKGLFLTGANDQPEQGLSLNIAQTQIGSYGTVTVAPDSDGVEGQSVLMNLSNMLSGITDPLSGPIHNAMDGLNQNITNLNDTISSDQDRLNTKQQSLTDEYNAANSALKMLQVNQAQLSASLPK
jgi:flagellar hook-associated protein 2